MHEPKTILDKEDRALSSTGHVVFIKVSAGISCGQNNKGFFRGGCPLAIVSAVVAIDFHFVAKDLSKDLPACCRVTTIGACFSSYDSNMYVDTRTSILHGGILLLSKHELKITHSFVVAGSHPSSVSLSRRSGRPCFTR